MRRQTKTIGIGMGLVVIALVAAAVNSLTSNAAVRDDKKSSDKSTRSLPWPEKPAKGITLPIVVESVHDGDTLTVEIRIKSSIRMLDCWAPEVTGDEKPRGLVSAAKLRQLAEGKSGIVWIPMHSATNQSLTFGRVLGHVWIDGHDRPLSQQMVEAGLATFAKDKRP